MDRFAQRYLSVALAVGVWGRAGAATAEEPLVPSTGDAAPAAAEVATPPAAAEAPAAAPPAASGEAPAAVAPQLAAEAPPPEAQAAKPKPPPYSLPWQLRPVVAANVVRSDTALAFFEEPASGDSGTTVASMLLASYKVTDELAPLVRVGLVSHSPPDATNLDSAVGFLNPVLGATYAIKPAKPLRLAFFLGLAVPVGSGGGSDAEPENQAANRAGIPARSAMDNAMFAVNDFTVFPGVGFAYVSGGFTAQAEATLLQLMRVKGDEPNAKGVVPNPDKSKTNFTTGIHVGYFVLPLLSLGAEIRHQRWLSTPRAVEVDEALADDAQLGTRDTTTFAIGPRLHFKLSDSVWFRPGFAFAMPLDNPMKKSEYKVVQLDLPVVF